MTAHGMLAAAFAAFICLVSGPALSGERPALAEDAHMRTLASFAEALGKPLGGADDGSVFAAANRAIVAAAHSGGLSVALPMGRVERTSVGLLLDNDGGYFCAAPGRCMVQAVRAADSAVPTWLVRVNDPYATNLVLSGITFSGGWTYGRSPYAVSPETDPWLDRQGGVLLNHAFSGVDDQAFRRNNATGTQVPRDHIENLVISGFAGDCLRIEGAGQNNFHNIRGDTCGGHAISINSYDNKFTDIDFGGSGRSCLFLDGNGATNHIYAKVWYCGFRLKAGDDAGVLSRSGGNLMDLIVQDTYGDAIINTGQLNLIRAIVGWQGEISKMDPGPIAAYTCAGCEGNVVTLIASIAPNQHYPAVTELYKELKGEHGYGRRNLVTFIEMGWPQDQDTAGSRPPWFEGPLDASNRISVNGIDLTCKTAPASTSARPRTSSPGVKASGAAASCGDRVQ